MCKILSITIMAANNFEGSEMQTNDPISTDIDMDHIHQLAQKLMMVDREAERCDMYIQLLSYIIKYPNFVRENHEFGHLFRQRSKEIEPTINNLVDNGAITFEQGCELVQLSLTFLDQTSFLAEFDFEETPEPEHVSNTNQTTKGENSSNH